VLPLPKTLGRSLAGVFWGGATPSLASLGRLVELLP
jgi:hypothetical protein